MIEIGESGIIACEELSQPFLLAGELLAKR
jgi:hypothetical protein